MSGRLSTSTYRMSKKRSLMCYVDLFFLALTTTLLGMATTIASVDNYTRADFPADFVFGAGSSAYQVEGAALEDGRRPSIWDSFVHANPDIYGGATADIACDQYHKYKEDVQQMVDTSLEAYRFSISWSRLIPSGRGPVNPKGLDYYNNLIDELIMHGIQPHVTLYHMDNPQALEDEYGGWLSQNMVRDFTSYADVCFKEFGDRVLYWTTFNEANAFVIGGYDAGLVPPGRCSLPFGVSCTKGNSSSEPYIAAHNLLLAHSSTVKLYNKKYKAGQHGFVGLNIYAPWFFPYTKATEDAIAAQRAIDFYIGWFLHPLVFGDYPDIMKKNAGTRIPAFTPQESKLVKGSFDFIGLNHYATSYMKDNPSSLKMDIRDFLGDMAASMSCMYHSFTVSVTYFLLIEFDFAKWLDYSHPFAKPLDEPGDSSPDQDNETSSGLYEVLDYVKRVYANPPTYIQENGQQTVRNGTLNDTARVEYMHAYIGTLLDALRNGANTKGYFVWSFLDGFEVLGGYSMAFGMYYVDLSDKQLTRYPKLSAHWYSNFLKRSSIRRDEIVEVDNESFISSISKGSQ